VHGTPADEIQTYESAFATPNVTPYVTPYGSPQVSIGQLDRSLNARKSLKSSMRQHNQAQNSLRNF
jgi:hypothetical protein